MMKSTLENIGLVKLCTVLGAAICVATSAYGAEPAPALVYEQGPNESLDEETLGNINAFLEGLSPQIGQIEIIGTNAALDVSSEFYFLAAEDAQAVLEQAWGNPPDDTIRGMIFAAGSTPLDDDAWGATISYDDSGYVSDEDADSIDYDEMMVSLQRDARDSNEWRTENGYSTIEIVGWAENPAYNSETHKMYWAKELIFGDSEASTLNYDIRVLGRKGTLVVSFIAGMEQLSSIRGAAPQVLDMAQFTPGNTYDEYQPGVDKVAAYGLAGLVGGAAIAKKTGLLAGLLLFGKKFIVLIIAGFAALGGFVRKFFSRGNKA